MNFRPFFGEAQAMVLIWGYFFWAKAIKKYKRRRRHRFQKSEAPAHGSGNQYSNGIV